MWRTGEKCEKGKLPPESLGQFPFYINKIPPSMKVWAVLWCTFLNVSAEFFNLSLWPDSGAGDLSFLNLGHEQRWLFQTGANSSSPFAVHWGGPLSLRYLGPHNLKHRVSQLWAFYFFKTRESKNQSSFPTIPVPWLNATEVDRGCYGNSHYIVHFSGCYGDRHPVCCCGKCCGHS